MTPLAQLLARFLPKALVAPALALAYAGMMFAILVAGSVRDTEVIYVDVRGD